MAFGRKPKIEVGQRGQTGQSWKGGGENGLRFDWNVKHTADSEPGTAEIKVWHWAEQSIQALREDGAVIRLFSGYEAPKLLFVGTPNEKSGITQPDGKPFTLIKAKDGGDELARTHLSFSFSKPVSCRVVLNEIINRVGLPVKQINLPDNSKFPNGITYSGKAKGALDRIAEKTGATWSVQDGRIRFLDESVGTGVEVAKFSRKNGTVIGQVKTDKKGISVKTLMVNPELRPEDRFRLGDTDKKGTWRAKTVALNGSSWAEPHYMNIKAVPP